jgi:hypothetical protein
VTVRELITIEEFVTLSAKINYQLSATRLNKEALLALVLGPAELDEGDRTLLLQAFDVLQAGYQQERRRLGTPGILHPLRAAALLSRALKPTLMHLLCSLLHDKDEDLTEGELGSERFGEMQVAYHELLHNLGPRRAAELKTRIDVLSNCGPSSYEAYLGRLLDNARGMPEVLHVKLCDRLDNTFDIHLQHPGVTRFNFYRAVFDILFLPHFGGIDMGRFHFMPDIDQGVMLLSQLFKDLTFLALLRSEGLDRLDTDTAKLFNGLAVAGIREAQWLALESFKTSITDVDKQRALLMEVMDYCTKGGIEAVTAAEAGGELDGILLNTFKAQQAGSRRKMLAELFNDRVQLTRMVLTFIVVFAAFINDSSYVIRGIGRAGPQAES